MNEEELQLEDEMTTPEPTDDDLAALLGLVSTLGEQNLVAQQPQEAPETEETAPEQEEPEEPKEEAPEENESILSEIKAIRAEIEQQDVSKEVAEIRAELEKLLEEEKKDNGTETENKDSAE